MRKKKISTWKAFFLYLITVRICWLARSFFFFTSGNVFGIVLEISLGNMCLNKKKLIASCKLGQVYFSKLSITTIIDDKVISFHLNFLQILPIWWLKNDFFYFYFFQILICFISFLNKKNISLLICVDVWVETIIADVWVNPIAK